MTINYYDAGAAAAAVWTRITLICTARGSNNKKILTAPTLQHDSALRDYKQNPRATQVSFFILGLVAEATDRGL